MDEQPSVRIDRWLWAARFYRTRSLAKSAVAGGKIHVDEQRVKPAKELRCGQTVRINKDGVVFIVEVLQVSEQRGSRLLPRLFTGNTGQHRAAPDRVERTTHGPSGLEYSRSAPK